MLLDIFDIHIHNLISIGVILVLLVASVIISMIVSKRNEKSDNFDHFTRKIEISDAFAENEKKDEE